MLGCQARSGGEAINIIAEGDHMPEPTYEELKAKLSQLEKQVETRKREVAPSNSELAKRGGSAFTDSAAFPSPSITNNGSASWTPPKTSRIHGRKQVEAQNSKSRARERTQLTVPSERVAHLIPEFLPPLSVKVALLPRSGLLTAQTFPCDHATGALYSIVGQASGSNALTRPRAPRLFNSGAK